MVKKKSVKKNSIQTRLLEDYELPLINMKNLYKHKINIEQFNFRSFENFVERALRNSSRIDYISIDPKYLKETCLDVASKNGLTSFVKTLLRQGVQINRVNKTFNRAPIHFATEGGHANTLKALLNDSTVNPNLQAGQQTALHIAVNKHEVNKNAVNKNAVNKIYLECASLLLKKGANANIPKNNNKNLTAICIAANKKQCEMVELILKEHWLFLDLDNCRDNDNLTIRQVIHRSLPKLSEQFNECGTYHGLQYYLIVNDETNFLIMFKKKEFSMDECETLLKTAVQNNLHKAVISILNWLKKIEENSRKIVVEQAACVAIKKGRYAILEELLNVVPEVANSLIMYACWQLINLSNQKTDRRLHISVWLKCMKLILNQKGVNIHEITDDKSNTPLHYAVKSRCSKVITLILSQDSYIGYLNKSDIPPIADIPKDILSNYFDNCIQMKTNENTNESAIEFNYSCLKPSNVSQEFNDDLGTHELKVFMYIANNDNLKQLLKHPLLSSFLYLKWYKIRHLLKKCFIRTFVQKTFYSIALF
ncbi:transient receptor potential cation channel protein painless isoform X2 [Monomorium pharaonis]|uniref:transient receptor potential cation channel protein painless isoform X2 n=1 Tax=Monomorium pharaonis TaxID=307658 RepID=UPI0017478D80|nr:transient receptor potential cation channel protein painless isoform X2 [Monomorium pharaonis]